MAGGVVRLDAAGKKVDVTGMLEEAYQRYPGRVVACLGAEARAFFAAKPRSPEGEAIPGLLRAAGVPFSGSGKVSVDPTDFERGIAALQPPG
jgi:hypothetical protein